MKITRKSLALPSGATTTVRPLSRIDFASIGHKAPDTVALPKDAKEEEGRRLTAEEVQWRTAIAELALLRACGPLISEGRTYKIVDKPFSECQTHRTHTEICIADLEQKDADMIVDEVFILTNLGMEDAASAATFPEGQK